MCPRCGSHNTRITGYGHVETFFCTVITYALMHCADCDNNWKEA